MIHISKMLFYTILPFLMVSNVSSADQEPLWDTSQTTYLPFTNEEILPYNLTLNKSFAFLPLPGINHENPDPFELWKHLNMFLGSGDYLYTQMILTNDYPDTLPLYSTSDLTHPIILIAARDTEMRVRAFPDVEKLTYGLQTILAELSVPDGEGGWIEVTEADRQFYSYHREDDWFVLTFPENRTNTFRCIAMTIATAINSPSKDNQLIPSSNRRHWLFIQLPWTDDPEVFIHLPYRDYTPYGPQPSPVSIEEVIGKIMRPHISLTPSLNIPHQLEVTQ